METKVLKAYLRDCKIFGWEPSLVGANEYNKQHKLGLREKWATKKK